MKVLFVAANPAETSRLALDEEMRAITDKVSRSPLGSSVEFVAAWAAQPDDLLQRINEYRPTVLHFAGHGSSEGIILSRGEGRMTTVSPDALLRLVAMAEPQLKVVLLNSCHSQRLAADLCDGVDAIIGWRFPLDDAAAAAFASSFYRAICFGATIGESLEQGIISILLEGLPGADDVELIVRDKDVRLLEEPQVATSDTAYRTLESPSTLGRTGGAGIPLLDETAAARFVEESFGPGLRTALAFFDVDGLLGINLRHGESVGDLVLDQCSELLLSVYGNSARACRVRGDQFVVVSNDASVPTFERRAKKVLKKIRKHDWSSLSPDLFVTVTGAVAYRSSHEYLAPDVPEDAPSLILRALLGVKQAKREGARRLSMAPISLPSLPGYLSDSTLFQIRVHQLGAGLS